MIFFHHIIVVREKNFKDAFKHGMEKRFNQF